MKISIIEPSGDSCSLNLETSNYLQGGMAVLLTEMGMPFATISVHLPETPALPPDVFYVKHWNENAHIVKQLLEQGIIQLAPEITPTTSGFIDNIRAYRLKERQT